MLHDESCAFHLFTGNESASTSSKEIEHYVSHFGTAFERFLVECWWLLSRVFVRTDYKPFCEPEVKQIDDVFENSISDSDFFVEYLGKISHIRRYVRLSSGSINARLVSSVKGTLRSGCHIVLHPHTYSSWLNLEVTIDALYSSNIIRVTPAKHMSVRSGMFESVGKCFRKKCLVGFWSFVIIGFLPSILFLITHSSVIRNSNIVGWIQVEHRYISGGSWERSYELIYIFRFGRISAHYPVISESINIS